MKKFSASFIAMSIIGSLTMSSVGAGVATAQTNTNPITGLEVLSAIENLKQLDNSLILTPTQIKKTKSSAYESVTESKTNINIPVKSDENIVFTNKETQESVDIKIITDTKKPVFAEKNDKGMFSYLSDESNATTVIPLESGVQILTTITDSLAPTEYFYEYELQFGEKFAKQNDGSVYIIDASGEITNVIAPPCAKDAESKTIPTSYEVAGNKLMQIIDHTATENVAYPVVADPIFLAPWVIRCLTGIGLNGPQIVNIASKGTYWSILAAFGYAAVRCVFGR